MGPSLRNCVTQRGYTTLFLSLPYLVPPWRRSGLRRPIGNSPLPVGGEPASRLGRLMGTPLVCQPHPPLHATPAGGPAPARASGVPPTCRSLSLPPRTAATVSALPAALRPAPASPFPHPWGSDTIPITCGPAVRTKPSSPGGPRPFLQGASRIDPHSLAAKGDGRLRPSQLQSLFDRTEQGQQGHGGNA
jgi:hypothetical protein